MIRIGTTRVSLLAGLALSFLCGCTSTNINVSADRAENLRSRSLELLSRAAQEEDAVVRAHAFEALADIAPEKGEPYFVAALEDEAPLIRYAACVSLGEHAAPSMLRQFGPLLDDANPRVRLAAAFAAYRAGDRRQADALVRALSDSPDEDMRCDAAYLIGRLGERKAIKRLGLAIQREKSIKVKMHIYTAMAMLGDLAALDELLRNAISSEQVARLLALQGLVEVADPRAEEALLLRLREVGDYPETRLLAARGVGRIRSETGRKAAYELAVKNLSYRGETELDSMRVRSLAALTLGAIGDPRALTLLERTAANENDPRTQVAACYGILLILNRPLES